MLSSQYLRLWPAARRSEVDENGGRANRIRSSGASLPQALYWVGRSLVAAHMRLALDVDIRHRRRLPPGPKILAANHPTTNDPFYVLTLLNEPVSVLVAAGVFEVRGFGAYLRQAGHIPVVRGAGATVDAAVHQVEAGRSVAIFPEGALSPRTGGFRRTHTGVARIALRTGAPVIPVGIGLRRDRIRFVEAGTARGEGAIRYYGGGPYGMTVGLPLHFDGNVTDRERVRAVARHIMTHIRELALESDRRIGLTADPNAGLLPSTAAPAPRTSL